MKFKLFLFAAAIAALLLYWHHWLREQDRLQAVADAKARAAKSVSMQPPPIPGAKISRTEHYVITSAATDAQTKSVADAVESLYRAYTAFFVDAAKQAPRREKLNLTLYKDRAQFKSNNRSSPWAEAYYSTPMCHAYYDDGEKNPFQWMVHEATHQLNAEVAGFKRYKWIDEGLATYFGTSRIENGALAPGKIDLDTYPIWWITLYPMSRDLDADLRRKRFIPLRALITGQGGPNIDIQFNLYYIHYWSLSHFLFHYDHGRYAERYRQLIREGGTLENFERIIGPIDQIQRELHGYMQERQAEVRRLEAGDHRAHLVWISQ